MTMKRNRNLDRGTSSLQGGWQRVEEQPVLLTVMVDEMFSSLEAIL